MKRAAEAARWKPSTRRPQGLVSVLKIGKWLSIPMLFFMGAASHFPIFNTLTKP